MTLPSEAEDHFRCLYAEAYLDVLRFVQRRTQPERAEDVTAEAFLVVWRRIAEVPKTRDRARAWLFGIARGCLQNDLRAAGRRAALTMRVTQLGAVAQSDGFDGVVDRLDVGTAWRLLRPEEQEAIAMAVWDGLDSRQAGHVLGISAQAYRRRLFRARSALRRLTQGPPAAIAHPLAQESRS